MNGIAVNISPGPGASSLECLNCYPSRFIATGTLTGQPAPDLSIVVTEQRPLHVRARPNHLCNHRFQCWIGANLGDRNRDELADNRPSGDQYWWNPVDLRPRHLELYTQRSIGWPGSYPVITLAVTVSVGAPGGVTDTASVSGGGETNTTNDTAGDYTTTFTETQFADMTLLGILRHHLTPHC